MGLRVKGVDLFWGTSPPIFQCLTAWALARLKRTPFLFEVRDLWPAFAIAVGILRQPILIRASEWLEKFLYRHADRVIVNSPGFIEHTLRLGARQVELVPNGSDSRMFSSAQNDNKFKARFKTEEKFVVLYAGAHGMSNDLEIVLEAAALLKQRPDIHIVLLGDGKEKPILETRAEQLGLSNLQFEVPIPKSEMPGALSAADACIAILKPIPLYGTVYPNKVFDYMAAGKPVLLAMQGVIQEVIEAAGCGLVIPPGNPAALADGITTIADKPVLGIEMGARGREYVKQHFDRPDQAKKFAAIIEEMSSPSEV
jgi:glycosyltransferase involved in cell wall biosynthesis